MQAVARAVIAKNGRLVGNEIGFLRELLGLSGVEFAALMDSTPPTVSRWENDKTPMGRTADLLLRTIATAIVDPLSSDQGERTRLTVDTVRALATRLEQSPIERRYVFAFEDGAWQPVADAPGAKLVGAKQRDNRQASDAGIVRLGTTVKKRHPPRSASVTRDPSPSFAASAVTSMRRAAAGASSVIATSRRARPTKPALPRR
jgi:transcriptional regulator with XRE-family HTH domain